MLKITKKTVKSAATKTAIETFITSILPFGGPLGVLCSFVISLAGELLEESPQKELTYKKDKVKKPNVSISHYASKLLPTSIDMVLIIGTIILILVFFAQASQLTA